MVATLSMYTLLVNPGDKQSNKRLPDEINLTTKKGHNPILSKMNKKQLVVKKGSCQSL